MSGEVEYVQVAGGEHRAEVIYDEFVREQFRVAGPFVSASLHRGLVQGCGDDRVDCALTRQPGRLDHEPIGAVASPGRLDHEPLVIRRSPSAGPPTTVPVGHPVVIIESTTTRVGSEAAQYGGDPVAADQHCCKVVTGCELGRHSIGELDGGFGGGDVDGPGGCHDLDLIGWLFVQVGHLSPFLHLDVGIRRPDPPSRPHGAGLVLVRLA
jgi:hypothetical protein